jgi:ABC-type transport system involved in resistance to organic solvents, auxiliary component
MNIRPIVAVLFALLLGPALAPAGATDQAEKRLKEAVDEAIAIASRAPSHAALAEELRPVLIRAISFEAMTRRAVGPGWRQFTDAQRKKATALFTTLIIRNYCGKFTLGERPVVKYKPGVEPAPGRVEVPTTILYKGSHYAVNYRLEASEGWRITDVQVEGVSLIANYRAQFDALFKKGGAEAVLNSLSQAVASSK